MKRAIIFLVLFACYLSTHGQVYQQVNTYGTIWKRGAFDSTLTVPMDTSLRSTLLRRGSVVYNSGDSALYAWNGSWWIKQGRSGSGGAVVPTWDQVMNQGNSTGSLARITGIANIPGSGMGLELYYFGDAGHIQAFDRNTFTEKPLFIQEPQGRTIIGSTIDDGNTGMQIGVNTKLKDHMFNLQGLSTAYPVVTGSRINTLFFNDGNESIGQYRTYLTSVSSNLDSLRQIQFEFLNYKFLAHDRASDGMSAQFGFRKFRPSNAQGIFWISSEPDTSSIPSSTTLYNGATMTTDSLAIRSGATSDSIGNVFTLTSTKGIGKWSISKNIYTTDGTTKDANRLVTVKSAGTLSFKTTTSDALTTSFYTFSGADISDPEFSISHSMSTANANYHFMKTQATGALNDVTGGTSANYQYTPTGYSLNTTAAVGTANFSVSPVYSYLENLSGSVGEQFKVYADSLVISLWTPSGYTTKNKIFSDGRMSGTAAQNNNEFVTLVQARSPEIRTTSTSTSLTSSDWTLKCNTGSGNITATLPSAVTNLGRVYNVKKTTGDANTVTIATVSSQTIDGSATVVISTSNQTITVQSDGANWIIL